VGLELLGLRKELGCSYMCLNLRLHGDPSKDGDPMGNPMEFFVLTSGFALILRSILLDASYRVSPHNSDMMNPTCNHN